MKIIILNIFGTKKTGNEMKIAPPPTNHSYSEKAKAKCHSRMPIVSVEAGNLVYLYSNGNKNSSRPRYMVTNKDSVWITIKKLQGGLFSNWEYNVNIQNF